MPSIKSIEEFSKKLFSLADEPNVLSERGESPATVEVPQYEQIEHVTSLEKEGKQDLDSQSVSEYLKSFDAPETEKVDNAAPEETRGGFGESEIGSLLEESDLSSGAPEEEAVGSQDDIQLDDIMGATIAEEGQEDTLTTDQENDDLAALLSTDDIGDGEAALHETAGQENDDLAALLSTDDLGDAEGALHETAEEEQPVNTSAVFDDIAALSEGVDLASVEGMDFETQEAPPAEGFDASQDIFGSLFSESETNQGVVQGEEFVGPSTPEGPNVPDQSPDSTEDLDNLLSMIQDQDLQSDDIHAANVSTRRMELAEQREEFEASITGKTSDLEDSDSLSIPAETQEEADDEILSLAPPPPKVKKEPKESVFSEQEYEGIFKSLDALPFDVKKECATFIANPDSNQEEVQTILLLLQNNARPSLIVRRLNDYIGIDLELPFGYEKSTASEFFEREEAKRTDPVRNTIRRIAITTANIALLTLVVFLGIRFVYRPLVARSLYEEGYTQLEANDYVKSDELFEQAWNQWRINTWALRYARTYADRNEYRLASRKYDEMVYGLDEDLREVLIEKTREGLLLDQYAFGDQYVRLIDIINVHKTGIYEHAILQSEKLKDFQRADELLSIVLTQNPYEEDALFLQGDNYIRWAEVDIQRLEDAQRTYTIIAQEHGTSDAVFNRFAWYFVKKDMLHELLELIPEISAQKDPNATNLQISSDIVEYLIDTNELSYVSEMLRALRANYPYAPEGHYQSARYYRVVDALNEERVSLENTINTLSALEPLRWKHLAMYIDAKIRTAENEYENQQIINAERNYQEALERYVLGIETRTLFRDPVIARFYEGLGDIRYYHSKNFEEARYYYEQALEEGLLSRELFYKTGNVVFRDQDYAIAVQHFLNAEVHPPREAAGLLATGSALYHLENYAAAESYFLQLTELLEEKRDSIRLFLPFEDPEHQALISYLIQAYNGLGVTRYKIADRSQNEQKETNAIYALEQAVTLFENYNRSGTDYQRTIAKSLPYVNLREILYPQDTYDVEIYNTLPVEFDELTFDEFIEISASN